MDKQSTISESASSVCYEAMEAPVISIPKTPLSWTVLLRTRATLPLSIWIPALAALTTTLPSSSAEAGPAR